MKKISLLLILCFLFQGCASGTLFLIGRNIDKENGRKLKRNKDCTFQEFMQDKEDTNAFKFAFVGTVLDFGLAIRYFFRVNPVGLHLVANATYAYGAVLILIGSSYSGDVKEGGSVKIGINLQTWENDNVNECKYEYFAIPYKKEYLVIREEEDNESVFDNGEITFLKAILNYSLVSNISQDKNFSTFQKDFLRNNKIQTYYKNKTLYYYIHYPGGKAKFEEDFGKYLYTNRQK